MYRFILTLSAVAAITATGTLTSRIEASPLGAARGVAADSVTPVERIAICFYVDGWNGPGLYECGFRHRRGSGWHGRRDNDGDHRRSGRGHRQGDQHNDRDESRGQR